MTAMNSEWAKMIKFAEEGYMSKRNLILALLILSACRTISVPDDAHTKDGAQGTEGQITLFWTVKKEANEYACRGSCPNGTTEKDFKTDSNKPEQDTKMRFQKLHEQCSGELDFVRKSALDSEAVGRIEKLPRLKAYKITEEKLKNQIVGSFNKGLETGTSQDSKSSENTLSETPSEFTKDDCLSQVLGDEWNVFTISSKSTIGSNSKVCSRDEWNARLYQRCVKDGDCCSGQYCHRSLYSDIRECHEDKKETSPDERQNQRRERLPSKDAERRKSGK
jgi:hypothetical protein